MNFVLVLAGVLARVPEIALNLWHYCAHSCEKGCQSHLVAVPRIYRFSSLREDQKVLPYLVKLFHWVLYVNIDALWIDIFPFQEKLNRINLRRLVQLSWLFFPLLQLLYTGYWLLLHLLNFFLLIIELELIVILLCWGCHWWWCLLLGLLLQG